MAQNKKKSVTPVLPVKTKKKSPKYRLLHVPSGQYLKMCVSYGYQQEAKKNLYGFISLAQTIDNILSPRLELYREEPLLSISPSDIILNIPGTTTKIGSFNVSTLKRIDYVDRGTSGNWPCGNPKDISWDSSFEEFLNDPHVYFITLIKTSKDDRSDPYWEDNNADCSYKIKISDLTSWDTVMTEIWEYLQVNHYAITLRQFSKDGQTPERVLLTEFDIVKIP